MKRAQDRPVSTWCAPDCKALPWHWHSTSLPLNTRRAIHRVGLLVPTPLLSWEAFAGQGWGPLLLETSNNTKCRMFSCPVNRNIFVVVAVGFFFPLLFAQFSRLFWKIFILFCFFCHFWRYLFLRQIQGPQRTILGFLVLVEKDYKRWQYRDF